MAVAFRDYYEVLGVPRDADTEDIRRAYRKLARENHPDINKDPEAEDRFKEISEAYEVLRDEERRRQYDRVGRHRRNGQDMSGADGFGGAPGNGFRDVNVEFGDSNFSDFFESMFGARRSPFGDAAFEDFAARGGDHEAVLELSLEEAAAGGRRKISLGDRRDYEVEVPPGVRDGQRIRLAGQGGAGLGRGPTGDLFLRVRLKPHPWFEVDGRDIRTTLPVTPWEAALGAEVEVPTLTGTARVKVPKGSSSGRRLRLRGQGLPGPRDEQGDLYAEIRIHVPRRLSSRERELFEQLAEVSTFNPRERR
jgi:curved DNA-binding protein